MNTSPVMTITDELLVELQRKAKAATPGPWAVNPLDIEYEDNSIYASTLSNGTRRLICTVSTGSSAPGNRAHIAAASPAVVDALVEHIRSLTERLEKAEKDAGRYRWLRDSCQDVADEYGTAGQLYFGTYHAGRLDAAIDAAIAQEGQNNE